MKFEISAILVRKPRSLHHSPLNPVYLAGCIYLHHFRPKRVSGSAHCRNYTTALAIYGRCGSGPMQRSAAYVLIGQRKRSCLICSKRSIIALRSPVLSRVLFQDGKYRPPARSNLLGSPIKRKGNSSATRTTSFNVRGPASQPTGLLPLTCRYRISVPRF